MPWGAAADEFAVGCAKSVEDGVIEFLVIGYKVEFISIYNLKGWASNCFRVVWESFNCASVYEEYLCSLRLQSDAGGQFVG